MFGLLFLLAIVVPLGVLAYCIDDWYDSILWKVSFYIVLYLIVYNLFRVIF